MKINTIKKNVLWLLLILPMATVSCKKENVDPSEGLSDGTSTVVKDLAGDTNAAMGDEPGKEKRGFHIFLFRFSDQKQIWLRNAADSARYMQTGDWDIAFTGAYNSIVYINNAADERGPGYGGPGEGLIVSIDKSYDQVTEAPTKEEMETNNLTFAGWDGYPQGYNRGWYFYDLTTHICKPLPNRTFVLLTSDGKYAKLQLVNVYKGNPPVVTDLNWPAPYLTFRYYVQQDGSRNLNTK
jgi:hypothetical protein